ncbi:MAG: redoxin domain-containing protein [Dehalococcoidia bacterium]
MDIALLAARLVLAAVFATAGISKLFDLKGSRQALRDFGLPAVLARPFGFVLPVAEIAVAVALLPAGTAWYGALGALGLLVLFVAGIGYNVARGRAPDCHCFGQLHSEPAGWSTLARNGVLALIAAFVVFQGPDNVGRGAVSWMGDLGGVELLAVILAVVACALVLGEAWVILQLLRQQGRLLVRMDELEAAVRQIGQPGGVAPLSAPAAPPGPGLPVGSPAPSFALPGLYGEVLPLDALRAAGKPVLLTFVDPDCGPCTALLPDLGRWQRELAPTLAVTLISRGSVEANRQKVAGLGITQVLLQTDREIQAAYQVVGTPSAVLVQADGAVGSPLAQGAEEIRALVARSSAGLPAPTQAPIPVLPLNGHNHGPCPHCGQNHGDGGAQQPAMPAGLSVGTPAPAIRLPDLDGTLVDLSSYKGEPTLVLFWDPGCGFCQQLLPTLRQWEENPPAGAPRLLVVTRGTADDNRAQGLRATMVIDPVFSVGPAFGVNGTPSAVLVDADGRIASAAGVGAPGVMALARNESLPVAAAGGDSAPRGPSALAIGSPAPAFALPDLSGQTVELASRKGKETLVVFWNPDCGFCQQMLPDLKQWEAAPPANAPELLVVSTGSAEANRALSFAAPVLLDQNFSVGPSFGANGTPMAVLVDAEGQIASAPAAGAQQVFDLANRGATG